MQQLNELTVDVRRELIEEWIKLAKEAEVLDEDSLECLYNLVESFIYNKRGQGRL